MTRVYIDQALQEQSNCQITNSAAHHLINVLRLKKGQEITVFNGRGGRYDAVIKDVTRHQLEIDIMSFHDDERESSLEITLVQGISRGNRMDITVQKAIELGVKRIVPVLTQFGNIKLDQEARDKRKQHWQKIIIAASEQCGRNRLAELFPVISLEEWMEKPVPEGLKLIPHPEANRHLPDLNVNHQQIILMVGPEGGFSHEELTRAEKHGFLSVQLGPRILRVETAAIAALCACQTLWGDMS